MVNFHSFKDFLESPTKGGGVNRQILPQGQLVHVMWVVSHSEVELCCEKLFFFKPDEIYSLEV